MPLTECTDLVQAAQAGDHEAFARLEFRYRPIALSLARRILPGSGAEDAVQDAFVTAWRSLKQLEDASRFGPWFAAIVRNRCLRLARQEGRTTSWDALCLDEDSLPRLGVAQDPPPADWSDLREAVRSLPPTMAEILRLYYHDGYSVREIASFMTLPATTVKWQLHAARANLRTKLEKTQTP